MTDKELLKQALNALEEIHPTNVKPMAWEAGNKAITALRSRLEQPDVEPAALKPCRNPYCECCLGACAHPGFYDACDKPQLAIEPEWVGLTDDERRYLRENIKSTMLLPKLSRPN